MTVFGDYSAGMIATHISTVKVLQQDTAVLVVDQRICPKSGQLSTHLYCKSIVVTQCICMR